MKPRFRRDFRSHGDSHIDPNPRDFRIQIENHPADFRNTQYDLGMNMNSHLLFWC